MNVRDILEQIVKYVPAPVGDPFGPVQALIFDSAFDAYRGVVILVRVKEGTIRVGDTICLMATGAKYQVVELGVRTPKEESREFLTAGDVGFITASIKDINKVHVGDTLTTLEMNQIYNLKATANLIQWFSVVYIRLILNNIQT